MIDFPEILATYGKFKNFRDKRLSPIKSGNGAGPAKVARKKASAPKKRLTTFDKTKFLKFHSKHDPDSRKIIDIYVRENETPAGIEYLVFGNRRLTGKPAINANGEYDGMNWLMLSREAGPLPTPEGFQNDFQHFMMHPWKEDMLKAILNADTSPITLNGVEFSGDQMSPSTLTPEEVSKLELI